MFDYRSELLAVLGDSKNSFHNAPWPMQLLISKNAKYRANTILIPNAQASSR